MLIYCGGIIVGAGALIVTCNEAPKPEKFRGSFSVNKVEEKHPVSEKNDINE